MEVFNFMPYTYYTRMTGPAGRRRIVCRLSVLMSDGLFLPCHFDRSEAEWTNLTVLWYGLHWGGRFLDSEFQ